MPVPDSNDNAPTYLTAVVTEAECSRDALRPPVGYTCLYSPTNRSPQGFLRPMCPAGYVALSDVVAYNVNCFNIQDMEVPQDKLGGLDLGQFRCVLQANLTQIVDLGNQIGNTQAVAGNDAVFLEIRGVPDSFRLARVSGGINRPAQAQHRLDNVPAPLYMDLTQVLTLNNPADVGQLMQFEIQKGLTSTTTTEREMSFEHRADFSLKTTVGIPVIGNVEFMAKYGFTTGQTSSVSMTDVISTLQTVRVTINVPSQSAAQLAQLIVVDSPLGSAATQTTLFTSSFGIQIIRLNQTATGNSTAGVTPLPIPNTTMPMPPSNSPGCTVPLPSTPSCDTVLVQIGRILQAIESNADAEFNQEESQRELLTSIDDKSNEQLELLNDILKESDCDKDKKMDSKKNNMKKMDSHDDYRSRFY